MTDVEGSAPLHEGPKEQLRFVFPVEQVDIVALGPDGLTGALTRLSAETGANGRVVGFPLSPRHELRQLVSGRFRGSLAGLEEGDVVAGYRIRGAVGALPSAESARFFYPLYDSSARRFLQAEILQPRRYSLSPLARLALFVFGVAGRLLPRLSLVHRAVFVWVEPQ